jgi:hypothetical protein
VLIRHVTRLAARPGLTLVELLAAVVVGGTVLSIVAAIALRQQRTFVALTGDAALAGQLRDAASMLPIDLRGAAVGAGDLREATDTSIELRQTIASAVACDTLGSMVVLAPAAPGAATFAGAVAPIQVGDTAWLLSPDDSTSGWSPWRVASVASTHAGQCLATGPQLAGSALAAARVALALDSTPPVAGLVGRPLRVTRPIRYSLYRSSDGAWYLGARDWNTATLRFNTIQPVAGPFQPPAVTAPTFRWFDTAGAVLAAPVAHRERVALASIQLRGQTRSVDRVLGSTQTTGPRKDSVSIAVSVRNRQ